METNGEHRLSLSGPQYSQELGAVVVDGQGCSGRLKPCRVKWYDYHVDITAIFMTSRHSEWSELARTPSRSVLRGFYTGLLQIANPRFRNLTLQSQ